MKTLRYSEAFYSVQGEGNFIGTPSVFLRSFGCNLRCQGFGLTRGTPKKKMSDEVVALLDNGVLDRVSKFEDLPMVRTGCDTYASIYPEFKKYMMDRSVDQVVEHILSLTPENKWQMDNGQDIHFILTGGEPLLWQRFWLNLFEHPRMQDLRNLTVETNTTQQLQPQFAEYLSTQDRFQVTWACSPKLTVSAELWKNAIRPEIARSYLDIDKSKMYLKFVVADDVDIDDVHKAVKEFSDGGVDVPVYVMPVGGCKEEYGENKVNVAELALAKGWRYSPRLQVELFGNSWGT
jgi:organic radical activating enzyme|tara:strand:- start:1478 stop:2350 length:873 start_codon:yes stop_codon:yes gene_type:complete